MARRRITDTQRKQVGTWWRIGTAAKECGIAQSTLSRAVTRGDIDHATLACGLPVVRIEDVRHFADNRPKTGRPKKGGDDA